MVKRLPAAVSILLLVGALVGCAASSPSTRLAVVEREAVYELTVPVSRLVMTIPKAALVPAKGGNDSPRYFYLHDKTAGLIMSGWFEPAERYPGLQQLWSSDTAAWRKKGLRDPQNVRRARIGKWEAIAYEMAVPVGTNSHLRAQRVQAGTWIDLHLSITSRESSTTNQQALAKALTAIRVTERE